MTMTSGLAMARVGLVLGWQGLGLAMTMTSGLAMARVGLV